MSDTKTLIKQQKFTPV